MDADGIQKEAVAYRTATGFQKWIMFCPQIRPFGKVATGLVRGVAGSRRVIFPLEKQSPKKI